jgi:NADH-quinone oxidoreductase subunit M
VSWREVAVFVPLILLTIWFGIYPKPVLDMSSASVAALLDRYQHSIGAAKTAALDK